MNCPYCSPDTAGNHSIDCPMSYKQYLSYLTKYSIKIQILDEKNCEDCGEPLESDWDYCPYCGCML